MWSSSFSCIFVCFLLDCSSLTERVDNCTVLIFPWQNYRFKSCLCAVVLLYKCIVYLLFVFLCINNVCTVCI